MYIIGQISLYHQTIFKLTTSIALRATQTLNISRYQLYKGTIELFEFFGGEKGHEIPMKMEWHNTAFNAAAQIGFGEYTFEMNNKYHGIVIMKFENRKIIKWREYQYKSDLDWNDFVKETYFKTSD